MIRVEAHKQHRTREREAVVQVVAGIRRKGALGGDAGAEDGRPVQPRHRRLTHCKHGLQAARLQRLFMQGLELFDRRQRHVGARAGKARQRQKGADVVGSPLVRSHLAPRRR